VVKDNAMLAVEAKTLAFAKKVAMKMAFLVRELPLKQQLAMELAHLRLR
jgi:hypothetical protein